jgi:hypothetical protein
VESLVVLPQRQCVRKDILVGCLQTKLTWEVWSGVRFQEFRHLQATFVLLGTASSFVRCYKLVLPYLYEEDRCRISLTFLYVPSFQDMDVSWA